MEIRFRQTRKVLKWAVGKTTAPLMEYEAAQANLVLQLEYQALKTDGRKRQWLAARHLLAQLLPGEFQVDQFQKDAHGKLHLPSCNTLQVSISHTADYVAAAFSTTRPVGIDIERVSPRIRKVAPKFLSEGEWRDSTPDHELAMLWCLKEAAYKVYGKKGLSLKEHIRVGELKQIKYAHVASLNIQKPGALMLLLGEVYQIDEMIAAVVYPA